MCCGSRSKRVKESSPDGLRELTVSYAMALMGHAADLKRLVILA